MLFDDKYKHHNLINQLQNAKYRFFDLIVQFESFEFNWNTNKMPKQLSAFRNSYPGVIFQRITLNNYIEWLNDWDLYLLSSEMARLRASLTLL